MSSTSRRRQERRKHPRAPFKGRAFVITPDQRCLGPYPVDNLSAGGAHLVGTPDIEENSDVEIQLQLGARPPLRVRARVVRSSGAQSFAIAFRDIPPVLQDRLQQIVLRSLRKREPTQPTVLIVDDCDEVRRVLERQVAALGCHAFTTGRPHEAAQFLQREASPPHAAIIDLYLGPHDGIQLLDFIASKHPAVRRVLISGQARACQLELALKQGRAHAVLGKPWTEEELDSALERQVQ